MPIDNLDTGESRSRMPAPPTLSPFAIRAIAVAHFTFAGLTLAFMLLNNAVDGSGIDQGIANTLSAVDTPQAQAMRRSFQRTGEIKERLQQQLAGRLPSYRWVGPVNQTLNIAMALLLIGAGSYLLQRNPMGRKLSLAFAAAYLLQTLMLMMYQQFAEIPASRQFLDTMTRMYPSDTELIKGVMTPISTAPIYQLLLAIYPAIILIVMLRKDMILTLQSQSMEPSPAVELSASHAFLQIPPPAPVASTDDSLAELLHRKTF